jgi:5-amino-6-(5-phosphoribosylamino)uracil reductase
VHELWPDPTTDDVSDRTLEEFYAYPADLDRPWVQVNFVTSLDGAVTAGGKSAGLSSPGDKRVFVMERHLADVILVGAATALIEGYRGVKPNEVLSERRERLGLAPLPPIAVVTAKASTPPDSPVVSDTVVPPIIFTSSSAPEDNRKALTDAGADVVIAGEQDVDLVAVLAELDRRGLRRVDCEGGPRLFGSLIAENLVDQLCLTLSPQLAAGDAGRIANGPPLEAPRRMHLHGALRDDDFLMLTYRR